MEFIYLLITRIYENHRGQKTTAVRLPKGETLREYDSAIEMVEAQVLVREAGIIGGFVFLEDELRRRQAGAWITTEGVNLFTSPEELTIGEELRLSNMARAEDAKTMAIALG